MASRSTATSSQNANTSFKYRVQSEQAERANAKGTRPLPNPVSVGGTLLTMLIQACRKILLSNTRIRVLTYLAIVFTSYLMDIFPFPRSYFSQSSNFLNQYFVKWGWAWTLIVTIPFTTLTSFTYCCGSRKMVLIHLSRICIATFMWFVFTKGFVMLENSVGRCSIKGEEYAKRKACLAEGYYWHSFDISGHAFILIYSALVIIEEGRAIVGWESIEDLVRNEEHQRSIEQTDISSPLKNLTPENLLVLRSSFKKFAPYVRANFLVMTFLTCLWDIMLIATALYFHKMVEKLIAAFLAISVWYLTYQLWYPKTKFYPYTPGVGLFKYNQKKQSVQSAKTRCKKNESTCNFMGLPINNGLSAGTGNSNLINRVRKD